MVVTEQYSAANVEQGEKLLCDELGDLLHVENMLMKSLPKIIAGTNAQALKELFEKHFEETRVHAKRVEKMLTMLERPAREKKSEGMMGLLTECQHLLTRSKPSLIGDHALVSVLRKVEAFEALSYNSVALWAELCGHPKVAQLAQETLAEEESMGEELKRMAAGGGKNWGLA